MLRLRQEMSQWVSLAIRFTSRMEALVVKIIRSMTSEVTNLRTEMTSRYENLIIGL